MKFNQATAAHNTPTISISPTAMFDSRVYNVPPTDVCNYFVWRQQDASRNSVQMLARHYTPHKEVEYKSNSELQDILMLTHNVNWNDIETWQKRGVCVIRKLPKANIEGEAFLKNIVDKELPIFYERSSYINQVL